MSRVNYLGQTVPISIRGSALTTTLTERISYPNREAAYYGNIFVDPPKRFACTSPGSTLISRACGPSISNCVMTVVADCDQVCDSPNLLDGYFPNCRDGLTIPEAPAPTTYPETVTVFRTIVSPPIQ